MRNLFPSLESFWRTIEYIFTKVEPDLRMIESKDHWRPTDVLAFGVTDAEEEPKNAHKSVAKSGTHNGVNEWIDRWV